MLGRFGLVYPGRCLRRSLDRLLFAGEQDRGAACVPPRRRIRRAGPNRGDRLRASGLECRSVWTNRNDAVNTLPRAIRTDARGTVSFEFLKSFSNGFLVGVDEAFIAAHYSQDGNRFCCRDGEVVKNSFPEIAWFHRNASGRRSGAAAETRPSEG